MSVQHPALQKKQFGFKAFKLLSYFISWEIQETLGLSYPAGNQGQHELESVGRLNVTLCT